MSPAAYRSGIDLCCPSIALASTLISYVTTALLSYLQAERSIFHDKYRNKVEWALYLVGIIVGPLISPLS